LNNALILFRSVLSWSICPKSTDLAGRKNECIQVKVDALVPDRPLDRSEIVPDEVQPKHGCSTARIAP
jgi:hypothetical protein